MYVGWFLLLIMFLVCFMWGEFILIVCLLNCCMVKWMILGLVGNSVWVIGGRMINCGCVKCFVWKVKNSVIGFFGDKSVVWWLLGV